MSLCDYKGTNNMTKKYTNQEKMAKNQTTQIKGHYPQL